MKWFSFFILLAIASCADKGSLKSNSSDSTVLYPLMDSAVVPVEYLFKADSLRRAKERDSFFAIKNTAIAFDDYEPFLKSSVDTSMVESRNLQTNVKEWNTYNKDSLPDLTIITCKAGKFNIRFEKKWTDEYYAKKTLSVNGHVLVPGKNIDTSLVHEDFLEAIEFDLYRVSLYKINGKEYLFFRAGIEKCNGIGCGYSLYLLYDVARRNGCIYVQFRNDLTVIGYSKTKKAIEFLVSDEEHNDMLNIISLYSRKFSFDNNGKVTAVMSKNGKQAITDGYLKMDNVDSVYLLETFNK